MNENPKAPNTEELLDRALEHYRAAEPRPGLEQRVLAELEAAPAPQKWFWQLVPVTVAALLAIATFYLVFRSPLPNQTSEQSQVARTELPKKGTAAETSPAVKPANPGTPSARRLTRKTSPETKPRIVKAAAETIAPGQSTFPSPAPATEQALLLTQLLAHWPELLELSSNRQTMKIDPMVIRGVVIQPLSILATPEKQTTQQGEEG